MIGALRASNQLGTRQMRRRPPVNLSLNQVGGETGPGNSVAHYGIQVKSTGAAVTAMKDRVAAAGMELKVEENVSCCYAVQDKIWVADPDGNKWEVFVVLDNEVRSICRMPVHVAPTPSRAVRTSARNLRNLLRSDVAGNDRIMTAIHHDTQSVWSQLSSDLRRFIRRRVPDDHTADDLLQETFVRIHRGLPALGDGDRLTAWVYRIANNVIADHHRKRIPTSVPDDEAIAVPLVEPRSLIMEGAAKWLGEIIDMLPEASREALRLSEIDELTQQAVADRLGLSLSGAKSRVQRGRSQLKEALLKCCRFDLDRHGNVTECDPLPGRTVCLDCDQDS